MNRMNNNKDLSHYNYTSISPLKVTFRDKSDISSRTTLL
jgi:hypothetical protein